MQVCRHSARCAQWRLAGTRLHRRDRALVVATSRHPAVILGRARALVCARPLLAEAGAPDGKAASSGGEKAEKMEKANKEGPNPTMSQTTPATMEFSIDPTPAPPAKAESESKAKDEPGTKAEEKKKEEPPENPQMGWAQLLLYVAGGISGLTFFYYFYKAGYSPTKTEVLMLQAFRRWPIYWPPQPQAAAENSEINAEGLAQEFVVAFTEWFILIDLQQSEGVTRDDVLELLQDFGIDEDDKVSRPIVKRYLERGEGHLEERRRLSGAGLQESVTFLAELFHAPLPKPDKNAEAPQEPPVMPREHMGLEAVEVLRKKVKGMVSISSGAAALQQAMQLPGAGSSPATQMMQAAAVPAQAATLGSLNTLAPPADDSDVDEVQEMQFEVSRLERAEATLLGRLERMGALSPAEESRLTDLRRQKEDLNAALARTGR